MSQIVTRWNRLPFAVQILSLFLFSLGLTFVASQSWYYASGDEAVFHYIGYAWQRFGAPPYAGYFENKTPGIYVVYAVSSWLFGVNFLIPKLFGTLVYCLTGVTLGLIARQWWNEAAALLVVLFYALVSNSQAVDGAYAASTETFMIFFVSLAVLCVVRGSAGGEQRRMLWLFVAGACIGFAIAFKQVAVLDIAGVGALILFDVKGWTARQFLRDIAVLLSGIAIVQILVVLMLLASGTSLTEYIHGAWLTLRKPYLVGLPLRNPVRWEIFYGNWWHNIRTTAWYPFLLLFVVQRKRLIARGVPYYGVLMWFLLDFIGTNSSGVTSPHQIKQMLPTVCLMSTLGLRALVESTVIAFEDKRLFQVTAVVVAAIFLFPVGTFRAGLSHLRTAGLSYGNVRGKATGDWIRAHTTSEDYVYVFDRSAAALAMAYSERRSPTRYFATHMVYGFRAPEMGEEPEALATIRNDLARRPPLLVLIPQEGRWDEPPYRCPGWLSELLNAQYRRDASIAGYDVFRRNDSAAFGTSAPQVRAVHCLSITAGARQSKLVEYGSRDLLRPGSGLQFPSIVRGEAVQTILEKRLSPAAVFQLKPIGDLYDQSFSGLRRCHTRIFEYDGDSHLIVGSRTDPACFDQSLMYSG